MYKFNNNKNDDDDDDDDNNNNNDEEVKPFKFSPNSVENEIPLYINNTFSNIQVMRINKVITKDKMS